MVPARHIICEVAIPLDMSAARHDLEALRFAFAELAERAATEVQRAGLDLDDVLLERGALVRFRTGTPQWQSVEFISDARLFEREMRRNAKPPILETQDLSDLTITALRIRAMADAPP